MSADGDGSNGTGEDELSTPEQDNAAARINFLLEEYRSLRSDLIQRTASHASLLGFLAAAAALATDRGDFTFGPWMVVIGGVLLIGVIYWLSSLGSAVRLGKRVHILEGVLNNLAVTAYGPAHSSEAKLQWETNLYNKRKPRVLINWITRHDSQSSGSAVSVNDEGEREA